jgi:Fic family protein
MGRLWQTLILYQWHPLFLSLLLESMIKDHQPEYYQALEDADQQTDSTEFIHFMLSVIAKTLAQNVPVNAPVNSDVNLSFDVESLKTPEAILVLIKHTPQMTRQQLADIIGRDIRTILKHLFFKCANTI